MINYNNGKIYKIEPINGDDGDVYIGSTTKEFLCQRMATHRGDYKKYLNGKYGKVMAYDLFDKYGIENCKIILLELVNANSRDELHSREAHYIKTLDCVNKCIPLQTPKEWYNVTKDLRLIQMKEYQQVHKNEIKIKKKLYYQANKEYQNEKFTCACGGKFTHQHMSSHNKTKKHQNYINNLV